MRAPAITVLVPVYNAEKYLTEAIDSILNQSFTDFELLIINDGSTDKSEEIILSYSDKRIKYVKNETNLKLIATLNKGFALSTGKYIVRSDADDINYLNRLEMQFQSMEQNPNIVLLGTSFETFGTDISSTVTRYAADHNTICLKHFYQIHLSHGTSIFRTETIRKHNLRFDSSYEHAEDYELWTRIAQVGRLANLPQVLYKVRHHNQKVSHLYAEIQKQNSLRVKQKLFEQIGLSLSPKEINLFGKIAQHDYVFSEQFLTTSMALLEKIAAANDKNGIFERDFLNKAISQFWFNTAYNCSSLGLLSFRLFFNSPLSQYKQISVIAKVKFFIKALLKR